MVIVQYESISRNNPLALESLSLLLTSIYYLNLKAYLKINIHSTVNEIFVVYCFVLSKRKVVYLSQHVLEIVIDLLHCFVMIGLLITL